MPEEDFISWVIEKRLDLFSERRNKCGQEEALDEIEKILEGGMRPCERTEIGMLFDRVRWNEGEIYKEGFKDGIRLARRLYDISAYQESCDMDAA